MQFYIVGGWVRDNLLAQRGYDRIPQDRDWVVVGATPEGLIAQGFFSVGKDFPVFIHPTTKEEYALARTERKSGRGYHGFVFRATPEVTLEEDLRRRDLTINAIAQDEKGNLYDPFHGVDDIDNKVLRHVSEAFAEDPVRLLRVARFYARLPEFTIADETKKLLKKLVSSGETDALVEERVGKELLKALAEKKPSNFFSVLVESGYWARKYPNWKISAHTLAVMDSIKGEDKVPVRFALMFSQVKQKELKDLFATFKPSKDLMDLAALFVTWQGKTPKISSSEEEKLDFLVRVDSLRKGKRFRLLIKCLSDKLSGGEIRFWQQAAKAIKQVKVLTVTKETKDIVQALTDARLKALKELTGDC